MYIIFESSYKKFYMYIIFVMTLLSPPHTIWFVTLFIYSHLTKFSIMAEIPLNLKLADKAGPTFISMVVITEFTSRTLKNESKTELYTGQFDAVTVKLEDGTETIISATGLAELKKGGTFSLGYRMLVDKDNVPTGRWSYTLY